MIVSKEQYSNALSIVESQTQFDQVIQAEYVHEVFEAMREAFAQGMNGNDITNDLEALRARETPLASITAAVIESAYNTGIETRG